MLELNATRNVAVITMNGEPHELYYRTPTTEELVGFQAEGLARKGKKIVNRMVASRIKYGAKVLTGFATGTIGFDGKAISSDPADKKLYRKDWKELLVKAAPQLVGAVGIAAFESVRMGAEEELEFVSESDADSGADSAEGQGDEGSEIPLAKG